MRRRPFPPLLLLLSSLPLAACAPWRGGPWPAEACKLLPGGASAPGGAAHRTRQLILVTLDGVRGEEVFQGVDPMLAQAYGLAPSELVSGRSLMPRLHQRLIEGVVLGAPEVGEPFQASGPEFVSLPGYLEIFTGQPALGCTSNRCPRPASPTFLEALRRREQLPIRAVASISSWERLELAVASDPTSITISAGRHGGGTRDQLRLDPCTGALLDRAAQSDPAPGDRDYRPDRFTAALALGYLAGARPRLLDVGLGDADERGHAGDYRAYLEALRAADRFLGDLFDLLAASGAYGDETTVVVTTDHGRAASFTEHGSAAPESRRVWLFAVGGAVPRRGLVTFREPGYLWQVRPTIEALFEAGAATDGAVAELLPMAPAGRAGGSPRAALQP